MDCITDHKECRGPETEAGWLPTRLIDVGLPETPRQPRLVLSADIKRRDRSRQVYVTLSHRWASSGVQLKLKSCNIDILMQSIPLQNLSSTFLDAIRVTRDLGVRYLWIDSLCILQDSKADWEAESRDMGKVYEYCLLNIAATGNSDNGGGLFQKRDSSFVSRFRFRIQYKDHDQVYSAPRLPRMWDQYISNSVLNKRGWVLQERILSPRTLHFASQLFWECRILQASETVMQGINSDDSVTPVWGEKYCKVNLKRFRPSYGGKKPWFGLIELYARCSITEPADRLMAVAGLAKEYMLRSYDNHTYLAGLWKEHLPFNLLWWLEKATGTVEYAAEYRCKVFVFKTQRLANERIGPSWSWAALDYTSGVLEDLTVAWRALWPLVKVVDAVITPRGSDVFGVLEGGHILLKGRVGQTFSLAAWKALSEPSISVKLDVEAIADVEPLHCLPIMVGWNEKVAGNSRWVHCLLLERFGPFRERCNSGLTRVGVVKVSLEAEDFNSLPHEIRWVVEFVKSTPPFWKLEDVTIY
ncbi:heterokaryon incompatibility protein-domain-containing protein [Diplogelasinospora grovesii]|uniref:Heterokaryon incompatibility protein-domain-containing protein n=1 Tax=Diplogelasinospora grovesii TaxID=303347 RepID=A0AAN6N6D4_9PEZI|nr:heterokaryon incompatibility protein-domain-containing protein [Diplogelasinospora grovesii]